MERRVSRWRRASLPCQQGLRGLTERERGSYISEYTLSYPPYLPASRITGKLGRLERRARLDDLARLHNFAIARLHAVLEEWRQHDSDQEARSL